MKERPLTSSNRPSPFKELTEPLTSKIPHDWEPDIDIGETPSAYVLIAEMPGVRSEHLNLIYDSNRLTIEAKAPAKGIDQWQHVFREERDKGHCHRVFALPADADLERRRETLHQGILTIHFPKMTKVAAVRLTPPDALEASAERPIPEEPTRDRRDQTVAARKRRTLSA